MGCVSIDKQAHTPTRTISTHKSITAKHEGCCSFSTALFCTLSVCFQELNCGPELGGESLCTARLTANYLDYKQAKLQFLKATLTLRDA